MIRRKTWNELWIMTITYTLVLELMLAPAILLFPELDLDGLSRTLASMGPMQMFKDIASGIISESAYSVYMSVQIFLKGVNVVGISCAVLLGTGMVARERENQTLEFLLGRPVRRSSVLFDKFVVTSLCVVVPIFLTSWSAIPWSWYIDEDLDFYGVTVAAAHSSIFVLVFLALATFFSVTLRTQVHVAFAVGVVIVTQVAVFFVNIIRHGSILMLSDFDTYGPLVAGNVNLERLFWRETVWLLGMVIVLYVAADRAFQRIEP